MKQETKTNWTVVLFIFQIILIIFFLISWKVVDKKRALTYRKADIAGVIGGFTAMHDTQYEDLDYIEEYTDSLQRVTKLLSYCNNKNKRAVIDDWDYVLYEYTDSTIVAIELVSPQWWYPFYPIDSGEYICGSPTAEVYTIQYDSRSMEHNIISSTSQTIRGWEYYATQLVDCNYYPTYEQAYEYVKSHFVYTEEPDTSVRISREPYNAYVPFYGYSYYKNGIGQVEPMGVLKRVSLMY